jgi:antitoxin (DNA-binding transcriptional repressor) of toxin-antitoxin stability system
MRQVNVHEAKTHLSRLIEAALKGEEVIIARNNEPVVRLEALPGGRPRRRVGTAPGLVVRMEDDFDDPVDDLAPYER